MQKDLQLLQVKEKEQTKVNQSNTINLELHERYHLNDKEGETGRSEQNDYHSENQKS